MGREAEGKGAGGREGEERRGKRRKEEKNPVGRHIQQSSSPTTWLLQAWSKVKAYYQGHCPNAF